MVIDWRTMAVDLQRLVERLSAENHRLRTAIEYVLADDESQPGGWGPDVTMVGVLKKALRETEETDGASSTD